MSIALAFGQLWSEYRNQPSLDNTRPLADVSPALEHLSALEGKSDHLVDRLRPGGEHHDAIETQGHACGSR